MKKARRMAEAVETTPGHLAATHSIVNGNIQILYENGLILHNIPSTSRMAIKQIIIVIVVVIYLWYSGGQVVLQNHRLGE